MNIEVVDYCCIGDESFYKNHMFSLRVWSERETLNYSLQRDYLSFCDLQSRLQKKFPRTAFPDIPLEGFISYMKSASKLNNNIYNNNNSSSNELRAMILTNSSKDSIGELKVSNNSNELIPQKKNSLTQYLRTLLSFPEIIICDDLKTFLDEEAPNGRTIQRREVSDIDVALVGEDPTTTTVSREHKIIIDVNIGDVIVWSWATKKYNLGFSINYVESQKSAVSYQRYDSHEQTISGCLHIINPGKIELIWDNTYARFHSKVLMYVTKILKKNEFEVCERIAIAKSADRQRFEQQRVVLRRALSMTLKEILSAQGNGLVKTSMKSTDNKYEISSVEEAMVQLREDLLSAQAEITQRDTLLVDERANNIILKDNLLEGELIKKDLT